jgi:hypothetical protein
MCSAMQAAAAQQEAAQQAVAEAQRRPARLEALHGEQRSMRAECAERWSTERAALGQVAGLQGRAREAEAAAEALRAQLSEAEAAASAQQRINLQLMQRKEEVEWQLMAALAKVGGRRVWCLGCMHASAAAVEQSMHLLLLWSRACICCCCGPCTPAAALWLSYVCGVTRSCMAALACYWTASAAGERWTEASWWAALPAGWQRPRPHGPTAGGHCEGVAGQARPKPGRLAARQPRGAQECRRRGAPCPATTR